MYCMCMRANMLLSSMPKMVFSMSGGVGGGGGATASGFIDKDDFRLLVLAATFKRLPLQY